MVIDDGFLHEEKDFSYIIPNELTLDNAVGIALLNNPDLQATFEEKGIAYAQWIEAGLWSNPFIDFMIRYPDKSSFAVNTGFSAMQGFVDILLAPLRKEIACIHYHQRHLQAIDAIKALTSEVQKVYYHLQAAEAKQELLRLIFSGKEVMTRLAEKQQEAGNIASLTYQEILIKQETSRLNLMQNEKDIVHLKQKLNLLLGLSPLFNDWKISPSKAPISACDICSENLICLALENRLDLEVLQWEMEALTLQLGTKKWWSYTEAKVGVSTEHEVEAVQVTGPAFGLALPFFNWGQAERLKIQAEICKQQAIIRSKEIEISSEVTENKMQLDIAEKVIFDYQKNILPKLTQILQDSSLFYDAMSLGVYELIERKVTLLETQIAYANALSDYWITYTSLERSLGAPLTCEIMTECCY